MNTWHGYPLDANQDERRPWWRLVGVNSHWERLDGRRTVYRGLPDPELARIDREHPLEDPDPRVGQVWSWHGGEDAILCVQRMGGEVVTVITVNERWKRHHWPPVGAVLVSGPTQWGKDCQWAPMDEEG